MEEKIDNKDIENKDVDNKDIENKEVILEENIPEYYLPDLEPPVELVRVERKHPSFKDKWFATLEKVGEKNGLTVNEMEEELINTLYERALTGDYKFIKDIFDRVYGKATETHEITGKDGKDFVPNLTKEEKLNLIRLIEV